MLFPRNDYSVFPIAPFADNDPDKIKLMNFCFVEIKKNRHTMFRRILIYELKVNGLFFYVMDIQPNDKRTKKLKANPEQKIGGFSSSKAMIYFRSNPLTLADGRMALETLAKNFGDWRKLTSNLSSFRTFNHTTPERMRDAMWAFMKTKLMVD